MYRDGKWQTFFIRVLNIYVTFMFHVWTLLELGLRRDLWTAV